MQQLRMHLKKEKYDKNKLQKKLQKISTICNTDVYD